MICSYVNDQHDNWDQALSEVVFAYNNSRHSSTGYAPNEIVFKKILPSRNDRALDIETPEIDLTDDQLNKNVSSKIDRAQAYQKKQFDKNVQCNNHFAVGDLVLLQNTRQVVGHVRSFEPKYAGPFVILEKYQDLNFKIENQQSGKTQVVHYNRLVKYYSRDQVECSSIMDQDTYVDDLIELKRRISVSTLSNRNKPVISQTEDQIKHTKQNKNQDPKNKEQEKQINKTQKPVDDIVNPGTSSKEAAKIAENQGNKSPENEDSDEVFIDVNEDTLNNSLGHSNKVIQEPERNKSLIDEDVVTEKGSVGFNADTQKPNKTVENEEDVDNQGKTTDQEDNTEQKNTKDSDEQGDQSISKKKKKLKCEICGGEYIGQGGLTLHMNAKHPKKQ